MTATHYGTLLLAASATDDEVRSSFRRLARTYHPDIAGELGAAMMGRVNEAYDVLKTAESRAAYDLSLVRPAVSEPEDDAWGEVISDETVDDSWGEVVDEPNGGDTDAIFEPVAPVATPRTKRTRVGISIFGALLLVAILTTLAIEWTDHMVVMGNWRITIPFAAAAAIVQICKRSFGWKLTLMLMMATLCGPLGALGVWGFASWSDSLGLLAAVAMSLLGPATWFLRVALNSFGRE